MCVIHLAGAVIQRFGLKVLQVCKFDQVNPNSALPTVLTMDPEPEQNPFEEPAEIPQPMTMERSLSSESGSNSSVSTVYFGKKSGSASSSRSGSGASTSRSPTDQEVAAQLLSHPSPPLDGAKGPNHKDDDHPSESTIISEPSTEEKKNESILVTKEERGGGFDYAKPEGPVKELEKGADKIVTEIVRTETILIKDAEEAAGSCCECCKCCVSCTRFFATGLCGDVVAVLCCPFTVISLLSCICFRCPKLFATKTADKVKARRKDQEPEFEESTGTGVEGSNTPTAKHILHSEHHDTKPEPTASSVQTKSPGGQSGKLTANVDAHRNYFFPSPEVEDDHPGGDKAGGR